MKRIKVILIIAGILTSTLILSPFNTFSQPGDPCDPQDPDVFPACGCPNDNENPACPMDGGVVALLAGGVGYGIKRARDTRRKSAKT